MYACLQTQARRRYALSWKLVASRVWNRLVIIAHAFYVCVQTRQPGARTQILLLRVLCSHQRYEHMEVKRKKGNRGKKTKRKFLKSSLQDLPTISLFSRVLTKRTVRLPSYLKPYFLLNMSLSLALVHVFLVVFSLFQHARRKHPL